MGQYLTIGLVTKFSIIKQRAKQQASATPLEDIKSRKTLDEWMKLAEEKPYQAFQLDDYMIYYTDFPRGWTNSLDTNVEQIILSLDGKIIMECYDEIFHFFARLIKERLSKYRLANALLVYISGTST